MEVGNQFQKNPGDSHCLSGKGRRSAGASTHFGVKRKETGMTPRLMNKPNVWNIIISIQ